MDDTLQLDGVAIVPLNFTVLVPCIAPKLAPAIVTDVPTGPEVGFSVEMLGAGTVTVNAAALLVWLPTVTSTLPVVAPVGTGTTILDALQPVGTAATPLNVTELVPCVAPKFAPAIVTGVPTRPEVGLRVVMLGAGTVTVNVTALLACPPTVITTLPVVAPTGTGTATEDVLQLVGAAVIPLNVTVLVPCVAPKFAPVIVTDVPTRPDVGFRAEMLGAGMVTVNATELLLWPPTVTTTLPVVAPLGTGTTMDDALQLAGVAVVPLNFTVLVPWVAPKFVPAIVIAVPTNPELGFKLEITGAGTVTVNVPPLIG